MSDELKARRLGKAITDSWVGEDGEPRAVVRVDTGDELAPSLLVGAAQLIKELAEQVRKDNTFAGNCEICGQFGDMPHYQDCPLEHARTWLDAYEAWKGERDE